MRNSLLCLVIAGSAIMGGIIGGGINDMQRDADEIASWNGVMVLDGGTVVANPAALSPADLARVTIVDPFDHITLCTDRKGDTFVNPKEGECENFKELKTLG